MDFWIHDGFLVTLIDYRVCSRHFFVWKSGPVSVWFLVTGIDSWRACSSSAKESPLSVAHGQSFTMQTVTDSAQQHLCADCSGDKGGPYGDRTRWALSDRASSPQRSSRRGSGRNRWGCRRRCVRAASAPRKETFRSTEDRKICALVMFRQTLSEISCTK